MDDYFLVREDLAKIRDKLPANDDFGITKDMLSYAGQILKCAAVSRTLSSRPVIVDNKEYNFWREEWVEKVEKIKTTP